jgi:hypothetical protein
VKSGDRTDGGERRIRRQTFSAACQLTLLDASLRYANHRHPATPVVPTHSNSRRGERSYESHCEQIREVHLRDLFASDPVPTRGKRFHTRDGLTGIIPGTIRRIGISEGNAAASRSTVGGMRSSAGGNRSNVFGATGSMSPKIGLCCMWPLRRPLKAQSSEVERAKRCYRQVQWPYSDRMAEFCVRVPQRRNWKGPHWETHTAMVGNIGHRLAPIIGR